MHAPLPAPGPAPADSLIYAGIDEAGYGPMLGPLCVGLTVFRAPWSPAPDEASGADDSESAPSPGAGAPPRLRPPNLWRMLRAAVCKEPRDAKGGRLVVNDSKRVKLANSAGARAQAERRPAAHVAGRHPLTHLEAGVLCFSAAQGDAGLHRTDEALFRSLGVGLESHPWYAGEPTALPLATSIESLTIRANGLAHALRASGVETLSLRAVAVGESAFNEGCTRLGSKAAVNFRAAGGLLLEVWERALSPLGGAAAPGGARVVLDRHGGRTRYASALRGLFERSGGGAEVEIETLVEGARASAYRIRGSRREMTVIFQVEAESAHLPVALASMTAKLVRELAMLRLNRHFGARAPTLAPTAGYVQDARRWLLDAAPVISADERRVLVRRQ